MNRVIIGVVAGRTVVHPDGASAGEEAADISRMIDRGIEYAAEVQEVEFTLRQAWRTPTYWLFIVANLGHSVVIQAIIVHSIPLLTDMGLTPVRATMVMGMMVLVSLPSRFIGGLIADRIKIGHLRFLMGGGYLLQAIGIAAFLLNQTIAMVYVLLALYYLAFGITLTLNSIMRARYFGRKAFGSIQGTSMMFMTPVGVIAPVYTGWIYDTTGSYLTAFTLFAGLLVFSAVVMTLTSPPKPPTEVTDIRRFL